MTQYIARAVFRIFQLHPCKSFQMIKDLIPQIFAPIHHQISSTKHTWPTSIHLPIQ